MTQFTMSHEQRAYQAAKLAYEQKLKEIASLVNALLDTYTTEQLETPEGLEAYAEQEAALHQQVGTTQAREDLRAAENALLSWGLATLKQHTGYSSEIEPVFSSNVVHIREKALVLCLRIDAPMVAPMVVCRAQKTAAMKAHGFYYFHTSCWDSWDNRGESPQSRSLSTEPTVLPDGYVRFVPIADLSDRATCSVCREVLQ